MDLREIASVLAGQPVGTLLKVRETRTDGVPDGGIAVVIHTGQKYTFTRAEVEKASTVEQPILRAVSGKFVATVAEDKNGKPEIVKRKRGKRG